MKKFVGGYNVKGWPYPLPLLAYLEVDGQGNLGKYLYEDRYQNTRKVQESIEEWIAKARGHQLSKYRRGEYMPPEMEELEKGDRNIFKIYLSELLIMMERLKRPSSPIRQQPSVYLYVYWKSNW
jgi:hypothetical protein